MKSISKFLFIPALIIVNVFSGMAQESKSAADAAAYTEVITKRADKIVATLGITDASKYDRVREVITNQYRFINTHYEALDAEIKTAKANSENDKAAADLKIKSINADADKALANAHQEYMAKLSENLSGEQIDKVKDGMTYGVLPLTYKGYQEMLPNLTKEQKKTILADLTEAREHAIDAPSSDKKHWWFGKYKGRINNYLSAQGIDMNKASKEWQERIKAAEHK